MGRVPPPLGKWLKPANELTLHIYQNGPHCSAVRGRYERKKGCCGRPVPRSRAKFPMAGLRQIQGGQYYSQRALRRILIKHVTSCHFCASKLLICCPYHHGNSPSSADKASHNWSSPPPCPYREALSSNICMTHSLHLCLLCAIFSALP